MEERKGGGSHSFYSLGDDCVLLKHCHSQNLLPPPTPLPLRVLRPDIASLPTLQLRGGQLINTCVPVILSQAWPEFTSFNSWMEPCTTHYKPLDIYRPLDVWFLFLQLSTLNTHVHTCTHACTFIPRTQDVVRLSLKFFPGSPHSCAPLLWSMLLPHCLRASISLGASSVGSEGSGCRLPQLGLCI